MANTLFTLDKMYPNKEVKKLGQVVRLHTIFESQKNGDINTGRNILS